MRHAVVLLLVAAVTSAAPVPKQLKKQPDAEVFVGTWEVVEASGGPPKHVWTFDPDLTMWSKAVGSNNGRGHEWKIKIDPDKSPKEIDIGKEYKGIYEIDPDEIRILYTSNQRPADFSQKERMVYTVIRRVKEGGK